MEELTFYVVIAMILLFLTILGTFFLFLSYSGLFHGVQVGAGLPPIQEVVLAYHFGRGPYRNCGYYFSELASLAPTLKTVGIYYDDPQQVEPEKLRWAVGCIVAKESEKPDEELMQTLLQKGYKMTTLPHVTSVVRTKFPNTTFLSFFLGIYKVYPALANYINEHKLCAHPYIEIYDGTDLHFMVPLARQSEFYVPEFSMEEDEEESDGARTDVSSDDQDDATSEKANTEVVEQQPASTGVPLSNPVAAAPLVASGVLRESFDRDTPVEASAKGASNESAQPTAAAQPNVSDAATQPGSPTTKNAVTPEGSSSEVDSESYEVVKPEDVSEQK